MFVVIQPWRFSYGALVICAAHSAFLLARVLWRAGQMPADAVSSRGWHGAGRDETDTIVIMVVVPALSGVTARCRTCVDVFWPKRASKAVQGGFGR